MAHVQIHDDTVDLQSPTLVEGLPGAGLVGKLATDHLVEHLSMTHYGSCFCDGLPDVAVYQEDSGAVQPPVRIYAAPDHDLLALQSDVPVSPAEAAEFATYLTGWLAEQNALPLYLRGLPTEKDGRPKLHGVSTGDADTLLEDHDIGTPRQGGLVSGPTGALLHQAYRNDLDALGLVVQSNKQFPDPEAARALLMDAIQPIAGVDTPTDSLVEQAEEVADAREQLAEQMGQATEESSQARPLGFQ